MNPEPVKFLVVDALAGVQTFFRQLLQGYGAFPDAILCCSDTDSALSQGLNFKPDFLVTDWFAKSSLTGLALYQRLKEANPQLKVALLSFEITPEHEAQAKAVNSDFLLKKPFTADELKRTMERSMQALAKEMPDMHRRLSVRMQTAQPKGELPRVALPILPPEPVIKVGDKVKYAGAVHTVQYVVHRHGETSVQLKGQAALIPVTKVTPA